MKSFVNDVWARAMESVNISCAETTKDDFDSSIRQKNELAARVKSIYNNTYFSRNYDLHMEETNHYPIMKAILHDFRPYFRNKILDPACGTGEIFKMLDLLDIHPELFIANDFSEGMLGIAKSKLSSSNALFTMFDAEDIKLNTASVGTALCTYGFHWFLNKRAVVNELKRVVIPGGTLIFIEEFPLMVNVSDYMSAETRREIVETVGKTKLKGLDELMRLLFNANFNFLKLAVKAIDSKHDMYGLAFERSL